MQEEPNNSNQAKQGQNYDDESLVHFAPPFFFELNVNPGYSDLLQPL
jgi:hypothetical protein